MKDIKSIKSVLLDNSFCIRLLKKEDELHQNCVDYYEYFLNKKIEMYLSTIVVSEYASGDDPNNLIAKKSFRLLDFDYMDAKYSGDFYAHLKKDKNKTSEYGESRNVVINDIKLFGQIYHRKIDAYITKDEKSIKTTIPKLKEGFKNFSFMPINLATPLSTQLGEFLFPD